MLSTYLNKARSLSSHARALTVAAAMIGTVFGADHASAAAIHYTGYTVIGDTIHISNPRDVTGTAGQITLTGVTGLGSTTSLVAWCLDIAHNLQGSGDYTGLGPLPQPLPSSANLIGGLIMEGNNYIAQAIGGGGSLS